MYLRRKLAIEPQFTSVSRTAPRLRRILGWSRSVISCLTDRVSQGYVVDFLDFYAGAWHWPAFNLADIAISLGAGIVVADTFGIFKKNKKDAIND